LNDVKAITKLVLSDVEHLPVLADSAKIKKLITESISTKSNFCHVSVEDGVVTGAVVAIGQQGMWFERRHLHILYLSTSTKGAGIALLRELLRWSRDRRAIKVVTADFLVPPKMTNMLTRVGMPLIGSTHTLFK